MFRILFLISLVALSSPIAVSAQTIQALDAGSIPADLRATRLSACGASLGLDRRWPVTQQQKRDAKGRVRTEYAVSLTGRGFWVPIQGRGAEIVVNPNFSMAIECYTDREYGDAALTAYAQTGRDIRAKSRSQAVSSVQSFRARGLSTVRFFTSVRPGSGKTRGAISDVLDFSTQNGPIQISGRISISREPQRVYSKTVPAGYVSDHTLNSGERIQVRLTKPARLNPRNNVVAYLRTAEQNRALLQKILASLRGL